MQTWLMNEAACPPAVRQEPDNTLNLLDVDFWLWYWKVTPKGMAHAFKIKFWETFSTPGCYDILTDNQYKMPNSNDGCMQLRAPTMCPEWNQGTDEDIKILQWLSKHTGLTSECLRGHQTICQMVIRKCYQWHNVEWGCKACSYKAGNVTSSMSSQDSRAKHCIIQECIWAVHPAQLIGQHGSAAQTIRQCHGHWWARKTCSWLKQTPR